MGSQDHGSHVCISIHTTAGRIWLGLRGEEGRRVGPGGSEGGGTGPFAVVPERGESRPGADLA